MSRPADIDSTNTALYASPTPARVGARNHRRMDPHRHLRSAARAAGDSWQIASSLTTQPMSCAEAMLEVIPVMPSR